MYGIPAPPLAYMVLEMACVRFRSVRMKVRIWDMQMEGLIYYDCEGRTWAQ